MTPDRSGPFWGRLPVWGNELRTAVYVDGFNLYHSALEARPELRWLDLVSLSQRALDPVHEVVAVRYFTARVKGNENAGAPQRQDTYTRALACHCPCLSIFWGHFVQRDKWKRLAQPLGHAFFPPPERALIIHREEKGSDVNLAVHLLNDAWRDLYDCAVLISDDSDLAEALALVQGMGKRVVILTPISLQGRAGRTPNTGERVPAKDLLKHADAYRHLSVKLLADSQLPNPVVNPKNGKPYFRPLTWTKREG